MTGFASARGGLAATIGALLLLAGLAFLAPSVGRQMQEAYAEIDHADAYFSAARPGLFYGLMPLSLLGAVVLVLAPGLLFCLAFCQQRSVGEWVLKGFAASLLLVSAVAAIVQSVSGTPLVGASFGVTTMGVALACGALARWRAGAVARSGAWFPGPRALSRLLVMLVVPVAFATALTPKFFWESFNGDGAHAYEATRLLLWQAMPFWPPGSGETQEFPGTKTFLFTFPVSWFIRLFGENEAGARLPMALFLTVLYSAVAGLFAAARDDRRELAGFAAVVVWLSLVSFALAMSFSATYDPYAADVGLPATQDTMLMACFLGAVLGFVRRQPVTMAVFTFATMTCSPVGLILSVAWLGGVVLTHRSRPWGPLLTMAGAVVGTTVVVILMPAALAALGLPEPGAEHRFGSLLRRFQHVLPFDFPRLLLFIVPAGIYPVLALLRWRDLNQLARAMWVAALGLFAMYYFMAYVSLHYFVPAMVMPLAAFWLSPPHLRSGVPGTESRWGLVSCVVLAVVAIGLGLPRGTAIYTGAREVGEHLEMRGLPDYSRLEPGSMVPVSLLNELFPADADRKVPDEVYGGSPLAWNYYAQHRDAGIPAAYLLASAMVPAPAGAQQVAESDGWVVFVLDEDMWQKHREMKPRRSNGRSLYSFPRDILFRRREAGDRFLILDLREWVDDLLGR